MYNGIGLATPRGSGTSGHVQRNLSHITQRPMHARTEYAADSQLTARKPNKDILDHVKKRQIEVQCLELEMQLEESGVSTEEIEEQVSQRRQLLLRNLDTVSCAPGVSASHQQAAAKLKENDQLATALGINKESFNPGEAFDPDVQEHKKTERDTHRAKIAEERKKRFDERESERKELILERIATEVELSHRPATDLVAAQEELDIKYIPKVPPPSSRTLLPVTRPSIQVKRNDVDNKRERDRKEPINHRHSRSRSRSPSRFRSRPVVRRRSISRSRSRSSGRHYVPRHYSRSPLPERRSTRRRFRSPSRSPSRSRSPPRINRRRRSPTPSRSRSRSLTQSPPPPIRAATKP